MILQQTTEVQRCDKRRPHLVMIMSNWCQCFDWSFSKIPSADASCGRRNWCCIGIGVCPTREVIHLYSSWQFRIVTNSGAGIRGPKLLFHWSRQAVAAVLDWWSPWCGSGTVYRTGTRPLHWEKGRNVHPDEARWMWLVRGSEMPDSGYPLAFPIDESLEWEFSF